jgi:uncharacterized membrane protein
MTDLPVVLATWLHTIAFVIAWGYYGVLGRIVLPGLAGSLDGVAQATTLRAIERRALPLLGISISLFVVTGAYLLVVDPRYAGLGNLAANDWTALMAIKHALVVVLVVLAVVVDRLVRRISEAGDAASRAAASGRLRLAAEAATGVGAAVVLLTAIAHAST